MTNQHVLALHSKGMHICVTSPVPSDQGKPSPKLAAGLPADAACELHIHVREMVFSSSCSASDTQTEMTIFNLRSCQRESVWVGWVQPFFFPFFSSREEHVMLMSISSLTSWVAAFGMPGWKVHVLNISGRKTLQILSYWELKLRIQDLIHKVSITTLSIYPD